MKTLISKIISSENKTQIQRKTKSIQHSHNQSMKYISFYTRLQINFVSKMADKVQIICNTVEYIML